MVTHFLMDWFGINNQESWYAIKQQNQTEYNQNRNFIIGSSLELYQGQRGNKIDFWFSFVILSNYSSLVAFLTIPINTLYIIAILYSKFYSNTLVSKTFFIITMISFLVYSILFMLFLTIFRFVVVFMRVFHSSIS